MWFWQCMASLAQQKVNYCCHIWGPIEIHRWPQLAWGVSCEKAQLEGLFASRCEMGKCPQASETLMVGEALSRALWHVFWCGKSPLCQTPDFCPSSTAIQILTMRERWPRRIPSSGGVTWEVKWYCACWLFQLHAHAVSKAFEDNKALSNTNRGVVYS